MNQDQIIGALRILLPTIFSYAVGKGWLTTSQAADITAAVVVIASALWSVWAHTQHQMITAVAAMPEVNKIQTTKEIAAAIPSTKVTNGFVVPVDKKP